MSKSESDTTVLLDRRAFMGRAAMTAGSVAAVALVGVPSFAAAGKEGSAAPAIEPAVEWGFADVTGACPPYAAAIGYGRPHKGAAVPETGDPLADQLLS